MHKSLTFYIKSVPAISSQVEVERSSQGSSCLFTKMGASFVTLNKCTANSPELGTRGHSIQGLWLMFMQAVQGALKAGPRRPPGGGHARSLTGFGQPPSITWCLDTLLILGPFSSCLQLLPSFFCSLTATLSCLHSKTRCYRVFKNPPETFTIYLDFEK